MGMDKLDIVIPLGIGSNWDDNELRYCLRSIEKYMEGYGNIIIIGECPNWLQNVIHIPSKDCYEVISRNINHKLLIASKSSFISEYFIYFNDDYFLTNKWVATNIPFYYNNTLGSSIDPNFNNWYDDYLLATKEVLEKEGCKTCNCDIHYPIIIKKEMYLKCYNKFSIYWKIGDKLLVKSLYCNYIGNIGGLGLKNRKDCKIRGEKTLEEFQDKIFRISDPNSPECIKENNPDLMFSIGDLCINNTHNGHLNRKYLISLYPEKSKYEI